MKKYLLSILLASGALFAMDVPTPMAGPAAEKYTQMLQKIVGGPVAIQVIAKQGDKTVVAGIGPKILNQAALIVARFNDDGRLDTSFNIGNNVHHKMIPLGGENYYVESIEFQPKEEKINIIVNAKKWNRKPDKIEVTFTKDGMLSRTRFQSWNR